jgi:general secretion pathway protein A
MYYQHFGFSKPPFSIAPDPHNLYLSLQHRDALAHLLFGVTGAGGVVLLTGEIGTGKTTLCRCLLGQLPDTCDVAFIFNPKLTALELLSTICDELHIAVPAGPESIKTLVAQINAHLLNAHAAGRTTILIIDEAQNLSADVLEQMRLLTNLETNERKLLQIILLGQPELRIKLAQPDLAQLAQRVIARFHLGPLSEPDMAGYISHRLKIAGVQRMVIPTALVPAIHQASQGIPRVANLLCDRALLGAYVEGKDEVDRKVLRQAVREVSGRLPSRRSVALARPAFAVMALVCMSTVAVALWRLAPSGDITSESSSDPVKLAAFRSSKLGLNAGAGEPRASIVPETRAEGERAAALESVVDAYATGRTAEQPGGVHESNEKAAWRALFERWGAPYRPDSPLRPCEQALASGLRCLSGNGTLQDLREINQPALLKLSIADAHQSALRHVTLASLNGATATLMSDGAVMTRSAGELAHAWTGEYTVLWAVPEDYPGVMERGERGAGVVWLRRQLVQLGRLPARTQNNPVFDKNLMLQVQKFQKEQGMRADGRVGPYSVIRLTAALDSRIPQLISPKKDN